MDEWPSIEADAVAYLGLAIMGALVLGGLWWLGVGVRSPWLPVQRVRRISWQGIDVLVGFFIFLIVPIFLNLALRKAGFFEWLYGEPAQPSTRPQEEFWSSVASGPVVLALMIAWLKISRRTHLAELGVTGARAGNNAVVGYSQWLILAPLTLAIQFLAVLATPEDWREEHPITRFAENSLTLPDWVLLFALAVVVAPVLEELVFRGIMLPWQVRGGWKAQSITAGCALFFATAFCVRDEGKTLNPAPLLFVLAMLPGVFLVPYLRQGRGFLSEASLSLVADRVKPDGAEETSREESESKRIAPMNSTAPTPAQAEVAIFTNGLFFAAMHSTVWPSPIPLFILGIGLAWVAYRTSSLVGAVTLHSLFNGLAVLELLLTNSLK